MRVCLSALSPSGALGLLCAGALLLAPAPAPAQVAPAPAEIHFADVGGGQRLAYLDEGAGPLVVLIHGFPDTPVTWDDVRPRLVAAGYRVVTPWQRGYAPSGIPTTEETSSEQMGRDILGLIDALGGGPAVVVGHDWGASAAYAAATLGPEKVSKLVTVAIPHPGTLDLGLGQLWAGRHFVYLSGRRGVRKMERDDLAHVDALYARWAPSWDVPAYEIEAVKESFRQPGSLDAALGYYRGARTKEALFDRPISVPTLAIGGEGDAFTPEDFADASVAFTGVYQARTLPGEHWPHRQSPDAFWALLSAFLATP